MSAAFTADTEQFEMGESLHSHIHFLFFISGGNVAGMVGDPVDHDKLVLFINIFTQDLYWLCTDCLQSYADVCSTVQCSVSWYGGGCHTAGLHRLLTNKSGISTAFTHSSKHTYCGVVHYLCGRFNEGHFSHLNSDTNTVTSMCSSKTKWQPR